FLEVNKEKMSKSLGNFFTAREMFERVHPEGVRYFMMTTTYRGPLNLDWQVDDQGEIVSFPALEDAERRVEYMYGTRKRLLQIADSQIVDGDDEPDSEIAQFADRLRETLDDDLNLPMALAVHAEMLRAINEACDQTISKKKKISRAVWSAAVSAMDHAAELLGLGAGDSTDVLNGIRDRKARQLGIDFEQVEKLIEDRRMARVERDFVTADRCRDELKSLGVELLDSPTGTTWRIP
ncbi:MAG: DALR domain-containing protein, partial [Myxococcota bacterium]